MVINGQKECQRPYKDTASKSMMESCKESTQHVKKVKGKNELEEDGRKSLSQRGYETYQFNE